MSTKAGPHDLTAGSFQSGTAGESRPHTIRVALLLGDDLLREGIAALIGARGDLSVVTSSDTAREAAALVERTEPSVVILDVHLPGLEIAPLLDEIQCKSPATRVIAMTGCSPEQCVMCRPPALHNGGPLTYITTAAKPLRDDCLQLALDHGARGVLHRPCTADQLMEAIRTVDAGGHWIDLPSALVRASRFTGEAASRPAPAATLAAQLTPRENQIVELVAGGRSNKEIARELDMAYSTVKNHVSSVLTKLNLSSRTQLVRFAVEHLNRS